MKRPHHNPSVLLQCVVVLGCFAALLNAASVTHSRPSSSWSGYKKNYSPGGIMSRETVVTDQNAPPGSQPFSTPYTYSTLGGGGDLGTLNSFPAHTGDPAGGGSSSGGLSVDNAMASDMAKGVNYFNYAIPDLGQQHPQGQFSQQPQQQQQQFQFQPFGGQGQEGQFIGGSGQGVQSFQPTGFQSPMDLSSLVGADGALTGEDSSDSVGFLSTMSNLLESVPLVGSMFTSMRETFSNLAAGDIPSALGSAMTLPMLIPMAAVPLVMGVVGLMAFPILQLTLPGIRRSFSNTASATRDIFGKEECMERFSCNLARIAKGIPYDGWLSETLDKSENKLLNRVSRSFKAARTGEDCAQFTCSPVTQIQKKIRSLIFGNKGSEIVLKSKSDSGSGPGKNATAAPATTTTSTSTAESTRKKRN